VYLLAAQPAVHLLYTVSRPETQAWLAGLFQVLNLHTMNTVRDLNDCHPRYSSAKEFKPTKTLFLRSHGINITGDYTHWPWKAKKTAYTIHIYNIYAYIYIHRGGKSKWFDEKLS
jgi:hypothetical protein